MEEKSSQVPNTKAIRLKNGTHASGAKNLCAKIKAIGDVAQVILIICHH